MKEEAVRWNIKVSKETDPTLRTFLGSQGMKKGDLSKFIEAPCAGACSNAPFRTSVRNAGADPEKIQRIVEEAFAEVRAERRSEQKLDPS